MDESLFVPHSLEFVLASLCLALAYSAYWFVSQKDLWVERLAGDTSGSARYIFAKRSIGFLFMGILPFLVFLFSGLFDADRLGVFPLWNLTASKWLLSLIVPLLLLTYFSAKSEDNLNTYPEIKVKEWTSQTFLLEYGGWALYLLGYEFLFRGLFFFASFHLLGFYPAVAIGVCVYVLAHIPKGWKETFGSFVLGFILCIGTAYSGHFWLAFWIHLILACSNSYFSFRANPTMYRYANR